MLLGQKKIMKIFIIFSPVLLYLILVEPFRYLLLNYVIVEPPPQTAQFIGIGSSVFVFAISVILVFICVKIWR